MAEEQIKDASRSSVNLGIAPETNALPNAEIHRGTPDQFSRPATYLPGHARLSPGDVADGKPAAKSEQPGKADPMRQPTPVPHPVRASDFARGMGVPPPGTVAGLVSGERGAVGPVDPATALFGANGNRPDFGQLKEIDPSNALPNNDDARLRSRQPVIDTSPSTGTATPAITKTPDVTTPWGPPDAWSKDKAR